MACRWDMEISERDFWLIKAGGKRIYATHGHKYDVKLDLALLQFMARRNLADVVLFGHTHVALNETRAGMLFVNPGAMRFSRDGGASYAVLDISEDEVKVNIIREE